jgi:teichuronic acid biosynthesis glycosyltransferase TuaG
MDGPLVSLIMPAFNAEEFIEQAINSVLEQSYSNWELIITNDGSTDRTPELLQTYSDPRILVITQENKGVSAARNAALEKMNGKYFTFLDADDILPGSSISSRVKFAEQNARADFIAGSVLFFNEKGVQRTWVPGYKGHPLQAFIRIDETAFCNPSLFIRKKQEVVYRFRDGMTHVEDLLFFATIAQQQEHYYDHIKEVVYHYRVSGSSAMSNLRGLENGYWTFYHSVKQFPNALKKNISYLKWRIIRIMILSYMAAGKFADAIKVVPKMITR